MMSLTNTIQQVSCFSRVVHLNVSLLLLSFGAICWGSLVTAQEAAAQEVTAQEAVGVNALSPATWKRTPSIDVKHISLDLSCDWSNQKLLGVCTIKLSLLKASDRVVLDSGDLQIQSIMLEGGGQLKFDNQPKDGLGNLVVYLEHQQAAEKDLTLHIKYQTGHVNRADPNNIWGSFGKGVRFQGPTTATPIKRRQIWSSGEPEANRYWFPGHESASDLRTTDIRITVDKGYTAIATGELVGIEDRSNNQRVFHYRATTPHSNFLTALAIGEYVLIDQAQDGVELHTYGYADEKEAIEASVVRLPEMLSYFTTATGHKYPFKQFTQVVVQDYPFPGRVGQHGCVIVSDNMIDDDRTHADFFYLWDGVEAQGLASQWFGNLIVPKDWNHAWLSLSFSRYMDALFNMHKNGMDEYLIYHADFEHTTVLADWQVGYRHPIVTEQFAELEEFVSDNHAKFRGALVLHMLRKELGEEQWWKAFRSYVKRFANKLVSTADMQRCFEESTGQDLGWFFDQWIYKMGHPIFEISKTYDKQRRQLTVTVRQTQTTDPSSPYPQVDFFRGSIELEIDNRIERVWIKPQQENTFTFNMEAEPGFVHFDYQNVWIKEVKFEKNWSEWLRQLQHSRDPVAQRQAMIQLVKIAKEDSKPDLRARVAEALRTVIVGNYYFRIRTRAMVELENLFGSSVPDDPVLFDRSSIEVLKQVIAKDKAWVRSTAISVLGATRNPEFDHLYLQALQDESDRVINSAAVALGKSKSQKAFEALVRLKDKPSWKNQSLISCLNGLKELGDPRGAEVAIEALKDNRSPRWWLATPIWDYPIAAAETVVALKQSERAFEIVNERFKQSMSESDYNDIFANALLISVLGDPRGTEVFERLSERFAKENNALKAVAALQQQFEQAQKK